MTDTTDSNTSSPNSNSDSDSDLNEIADNTSPPSPLTMRDLKRAIDQAALHPEVDTDTQVAIIDEAGYTYSILRVEVEGTLHDEDGNRISTGPTVWIKVEEN